MDGAPEARSQVAPRGMKMAKVAPVESESQVQVVTIPRNTNGVHSQRGSLSVPPEDIAPKGRGRNSLVHWVRHSARSIFHRTGWYDSAIATGQRKFLRGKIFAVVAGIALLIALFFGEIFAIAQVPGNLALDIILCLVFAVFAYEFLSLALNDASYLLSFFFWMDLLGTFSMVFDISFMFGPDATQPHRVDDGNSGGGNVVVVRAARAAKLGARAGRISRVMKLLRFIPLFLNKDDRNVQKDQMAKVISNQLTNVLSTRVAFTTIMVVIVLPVFGMFTYPEVDDSMGAWTELLARNAEAYQTAVGSDDISARTIATSRFNDELSRFSDFYSSLSYGPYEVALQTNAGQNIVGQGDALDFQTPFSEPRRHSSIRILNKGMIEISFDMATVKQQEAGSNIGLICFIILVMVCFGLVMSSSISSIALRPLERMLSVVRDRCKQIFGYTSALENAENDENKQGGNEEYDDMEQESEFALLEKVVGKLAAIVKLSTSNQGPEMKAEMTEGDFMTLNWMQGAQVPAATSGMRMSTFQKPFAIDESSTGSADETSSPRTAKAGVSPALSTISQEVLDSLNTPGFNPLDLSKDQKCVVAVHIVINSEGCQDWIRANVREKTVQTFVNILETKYRPNPFHNFAHAVDVEYSCYRFMRLIAAHTFLSELSQFWLLIAAVSHDIGHSGVNNPYLVETANELALRYNDRSPLENMHCAQLFQIISSPEANVFGLLEKEAYKETRMGIINAILHTDVTRHAEMIKEMGMLYQLNAEGFDAMEPGEVLAQSQNSLQLVINSLLHGADIGNPCKPWDLCYRYAYLCLDEFFAQGDLEKAAKIPVQMLNDRDKVNRPNSQIGFIEFVITPMVSAMVKLFPQLDSLADHLGANIQNWSKVWQEESSPDQDAITKVDARVGKVQNTCHGLIRKSDGS